MELEIIKSKKKEKKIVPHYVLSINFEDSGGNCKADSVNIDINHVDSLKQMVLAAACCCAAYPNGRAGYDEYFGLPEYDAFFTETVNPRYYKQIMVENGFQNEQCTMWIDTTNEKRSGYSFIYEFLKNKYNPNGYYIEHPCDLNDISMSFSSYNVKYVDENGNSHKVKVKFSDNELVRIKECETKYK